MVTTAKNGKHTEVKTAIARGPSPVKRGKGIAAALADQEAFEQAQQRIQKSAKPTERVIVEIPVGEIWPHEENRKITKEDCKELAEWINREGKVLVPLRVRTLDSESKYKLPAGNYQLLCGERRWRAVRELLGWQTVPAEVDYEMDDATALRILHEDNAQRKDLNDVERARALKRLHDPVTQGGAGMTWEQAAQVYSLTGPAATNLVKILEAPKQFLDWYVSPLTVDEEEGPRNIHQATLRELAKFAHVPQVISELEAIYSDGKRRKNTTHFWWSFHRDEQVDLVADVAHELSRPMDGIETHHYGYQVGSHPRLFEVDTKTTDLLRPVELPIGDKGKPMLVTFEVEKFDKLNLPAIEKKKQSGGSKAKAKTKTPKLSPAAQAAEDKRKAKEAELRLTNFVDEWKESFLRLSIAEGITPGEPIIGYLLPYLMSNASWEINRFIADATNETAIVLGMPLKKGSSRDQGNNPDLCNLIGLLAGGGAMANDKKGTALLGDHYSCRLTKMLLWPVSEHLEKPQACVVSGQIPERFPDLCLEEIEALAKLREVTIADAWTDGATDDTHERRMIEQLLNRHTLAQLFRLRDELNVLEGREGMGKAELIGCIMNAHRPGNPLPLPKLLGGETAKPKKKGAK